MTPQIFGIDHAPTALPIWQTMMDDLCNPPAKRVARVLGLGVRTVHRYNATGYAPRHVCLAIYWLTRWGRSAVAAQATNDAILMASYTRSLHERAIVLANQVEHLLTIGAFDTANTPLIDAKRLPHGRTHRLQAALAAAIDVRRLVDQVDASSPDPPRLDSTGSQPETGAIDATQTTERGNPNDR